MGYYTYYSIDVCIKHAGKLESIPVEQRVEIIKRLRAENDDTEDAFNEYGNCNENLKWYTHENDLKSFSKKYPDFVFKLHGEGEEVGDIWDNYFCNGKIQRCQAEIRIPEFDESRLE